MKKDHLLELRQSVLMAIESSRSDWELRAALTSILLADFLMIYTSLLKEKYGTKRGKKTK